MTSARLGEAWPEVAERLGKLLACRGVDPVLAEDIVQDVAVRALDKQVPFTDPNDLYRWAAVAARNIHIDHLRCGGRTTEVESLVGVPDSTDVAYAAERRVALAHVWRAIAVLRPIEREAILGTLDEEPTARSAGAHVRRHRARATLRKAVGGMIAVTVAARLKLRAVSPMVRTAGAVAMVTPVLALDLGGITAGAGAGAQQARAGAGRAVVVDAVPLARSNADTRAGRSTPAPVAALAAAASSRTTGEPPSQLGNRNVHRFGAGPATVDQRQDAKEPGDAVACAGDLPLVPGTLCVEQVPPPVL